MDEKMNERKRKEWKEENEVVNESVHDCKIKINGVNELDHTAIQRHVVTKGLVTLNSSPDI